MSSIDRTYWRDVHEATYRRGWTIDKPYTGPCVVVIGTRYGGAYEGGLFTAMPREDLSSAAFGEDCAAADWWHENAGRVGIGSTPDLALKDWYEKTAEMNLTVACLYVAGEYPYTPEYVYNLEAMCARWIDRPFEFVCLTDRPELLPGIQTITVQKLPDCFAYWTKLELFNPARAWRGRVLCLDLDVLIVRPLAPIIDYPEPFVTTSDLQGKTGFDKYGRQIVRRFNSSIMAWDGGTHTHLFERWSPAVAARLSGDQDWLAEQLPDAVGLPRAWFPRLSEVPGGPPFDPLVKVVLTKNPKNHLAIERFSWFGPLWRLA